MTERDRNGSELVGEKRSKTCIASLLEKKCHKPYIVDNIVLQGF